MVSAFGPYSIGVLDTGREKKTRVGGMDRLPFTCTLLVKGDQVIQTLRINSRSQILDVDHM